MAIQKALPGIHEPHSTEQSLAFLFLTRLRWGRTGERVGLSGRAEAMRMEMRLGAFHQSLSGRAWFVRLAVLC